MEISEYIFQLGKYVNVMKMVVKRAIHQTKYDGSEEDKFRRKLNIF